jgi:hypothetical protein
LSNYVGGSCTIDLECVDSYECSVDSCVRGSCSYDLSGCDCSSADANNDGFVNVVNLTFVSNSFSVDLSGDVNGDGEVNVLDLTIVSTRINNPCPSA